MSGPSAAGGRPKPTAAALFGAACSAISWPTRAIWSTRRRCGVACVLPVLLGRMEARFVLPIGFAILSLEHAAVHPANLRPRLPGQQKRSASPAAYSSSGAVWLRTSFSCVAGRSRLAGSSRLHVLTAAAFALSSAIGAVLLEWYCPIRGWKIESDLWHHPRK